MESCSRIKDENGRLAREEDEGVFAYLYKIDTQAGARCSPHVCL